MSRDDYPKLWQAVLGGGASFALGVTCNLVTDALPPRPWIPVISAGTAFVIYLPVIVAEVRRALQRGVPAQEAVLTVVDPSGNEVGHAVRIVWGRWLVCPARVVLRALSHPWYARPRRSDTVSLRARRPGGTATVEAKVALWGPGRAGDDARLAVLRTTKRLPGRGGRALGASAPEVESVAVLRAGTTGGTTGWAPGRRTGGSVELDDGSTVTPGSVVVTDDAFVGFVEPDDAQPSVGTPPGGPAPGPGLTLIDARTAVRLRSIAVSRRTAITGCTAAALVGGTAGGAYWWITRPTRVNGAGWDVLFAGDDGGPAPWLRGGPVIEQFTKQSGREALRLTTAELEELDVITSPNDFIASELRQHVKSLLGRDPLAVETICTDSTVVLARRSFLPAMATGRMLVRPKGRDGVYLDLARYLECCHTRWSDLDPALARLVTDVGGQQVTIDTADPRTSGGGQNVLAALERTRSTMPRKEQKASGFATTESLWRHDPYRQGPLARRMPSSSSDLLDTLRSGDRPVIFAYEHDALREVTTDPGLVLLRTIREARFTQKLVVLTEAGQTIRRRLRSSAAADYLSDRGIKVPGRETKVEARLRAHHATVAGLVGRVEEVSWPAAPVDLDKDSVERYLALFERTS